MIKPGQINIVVEADVNSMTYYMERAKEEPDLSVYPNGGDASAHNIRTRDFVCAMNGFVNGRKEQAIASLAGSDARDSESEREELMNAYHPLGVSITNIEKKKYGDRHNIQEIDMTVQTHGMTEVVQYGTEELHAGDMLMISLPDPKKVAADQIINKNSKIVPFIYEKFKPDIPGHAYVQILNDLNNEEKNFPEPTEKEDDYSTSADKRTAAVKWGIKKMIQMVRNNANTEEDDLVKEIIAGEGFKMSHNAINRYYHSRLARVVGVCRTPSVKKGQKFDMMLKL